VKRCLKLAEPPLLTAYRAVKQDATWDELRNDAFDQGQQAAREVKTTLVRGQRCLCAFCETHIAEGTSDGEIDARKRDQRVEHFHPKSDPSRPPNWNLHWPNLWGVCLGGSDKSAIQQQADIYPLPENLSCDAFKDHQIRAGKLSSHPEGWIMAPDEVPALTLLFQYAPNGAPEPHMQNCAATVLPNNNFDDTASLVANTILHLNLGCARLNAQRLVVKKHLEKEITLARQRAGGQTSQQAMMVVVRRFFRQDPASPWSHFFSLVRSRLGDVAEQHLQSIGYQG